MRLAFRGVEFPDENKRSIGLRCVRSDQEDPLWFDANVTAISSNQSFYRGSWYQLNWFGSYFKTELFPGWVFHLEYGWVYPDPDGKGSYDNWIYFPKAGWLWTSKLVFPYFYRHQDGEWYDNLRVNSSPAIFQRYSDQQKFNWGSIF